MGTLESMRIEELTCGSENVLHQHIMFDTRVRLSAKDLALTVSLSASQNGPGSLFGFGFEQGEATSRY